MLGASIVDVTADSEDDIAEVVDIGDSGDDITEEAPCGAPPLRFHGYKRGRELGRGASGQVFICKRRGSSGGFAVKAVDLRKMRLSPQVEREQKKLRREVDILKRLPPHRRVVQLVDAFEEGDWFLLVLELVGGGDLYTVLTSRDPPRLMEREAAFVLQQLADGLQFLHAQCIIHRDLKLENVLVASEHRGEGSLVFYEVKITDFGLSKAVGVGLSEALSTVGTHPYIAPEVMSTKSYGSSADIWCLGVLVYVLLAGQFPFENAAAEQTEVDRIVAKLKVSEAARSVLVGLLQLEPGARLCLEGLCAHGWLQPAVDLPVPERPWKRSRSAGARGDPLVGSPDAMNLKEGLIGESRSRWPSGDVLLMTRPVPPAPPMPPLETPPESPNGVGDSCTSFVAIPAEVMFDQERQEVETLFEVPVQRGTAENGVTAPALAMRDVRPACQQPDVMQVHIAVPEHAGHSVLGKHAERLKQLAITAGCQMWVTPHEEGESIHRRVVMIGRYSDCATAQEILQGAGVDGAQQVSTSSPGGAEDAQFVSTSSPEGVDDARQMSRNSPGEADAARQMDRSSPTGADGSQQVSGSSPGEPEVEAVLLVRAEAVGVVIGKQGFCLQQIEEQSGATIHMLRDEVAGQRPCCVAGSLASVLRAQKHIFDLVRAVPVALRSALSTTAAVNGATSIARLLVPAGLAGAIVGKQGAGLRYIRECCGVKVQMLHETQTPRWPKRRMLILRGPTDHMRVAVDAVLGLTGMGCQDTCSLGMLVPSWQLQVATKEHGRNFSERVREQSSATVELDHGEAPGEHLVSVNGPPDQVLMAVVGILQILEEQSSSGGAHGQVQTQQQELLVT